MATQKITIKQPIKLGPDWAVTSAWVTDGPIVLIRATSLTGLTVHSRLDMQKSMFIDSPLTEIKKADIQHLVKVLYAAVDTPNW